MVLIGLAVPPSVRAECAAPPELQLAERNLQLLPPNPVVHLLQNYGSSDSFRAYLRAELATGGMAKHTVKRIYVRPRSRDFHPYEAIYAIRIEAPTGSEVVLWLGDLGAELGRFRIGPPKSEPRSEVSVVDAGEASRAWTCSMEATRHLKPSLAAALYRVVWAHSLADFKAGRRQETFVPLLEPFDTGAPLGPLEPLALPPDQSGADRNHLRLGHQDCAGENFSWKGRAVFLGVTAILPDGTETPLPATPLRVEPPTLPQ